MASSSKSVLLVDDNPGIRKGLRVLFEAAGFICAECENGAQAVDRVDQPKVDLVVMDLSMPVMNGLVAASLIRKKLPQTPILMFTMFADHALSDLAVAAGVTAVFSKDHEAGKLVSRASALLNPSSE